ncbi:MAG: hypothetical protein ACYS80_10750 [Planctomycetota bacterium]|jgi:hypothetical protein
MLWKRKRSEHYFYEMFDLLSKEVCEDCKPILISLRNEYPQDRLPVLAYAWTLFWNWLTNDLKNILRNHRRDQRGE